VNRPEPLTAAHDVADFTCGEDMMDAWLKRRALANQTSGASRTYVVCDEAGRVIAYYSLATGAVAAVEATGRFRRNMPDPIPVIVLARLAVDKAYQGHGLSRALVGDALRRVENAATIVGIRGVVVHLLSKDLQQFYTHLGFSSSPLDEMLLMVTLTDVRAGLQELS